MSDSLKSTGRFASSFSDAVAHSAWRSPGARSPRSITPASLAMPQLAVPLGRRKLSSFIGSSPSGRRYRYVARQATARTPADGPGLALPLASGGMDQEETP